MFHGQVFASTVVLPAETRVCIETMEELVAKGDRVTQGQLVASQVWRDVVIDGVVVVKAGTPVISRVDSVMRFEKGINFIEIANQGTPERVATRLMVDIEI